MFQFHKPKMYRSLQGCCICRAKSSSSRFTDSKKYEDDFADCFQVSDLRSGEICNACVLLVKRWKKLPAGSTRNWHHVVDARAGPGTKSMNKIKNKAAGTVVKDDCFKEERFKKKHKHKRQIKRQHIVTRKTQQAVKVPPSPSTFSDDIGDDCVSEDRFSSMDCLSQSEVASDDESSSRSQGSRLQVNGKSPDHSQFSSFLDLSYWKKSEICCGIIFRGINGEVLIDPSLMHPCRSCKQRNHDDQQSHHHDNTTALSYPQPDSSYSLTAKRPTVVTSGGSLAANYPPVPVEIDPMFDDQTPALSPVSAHTPALYCEDDEKCSNPAEAAAPAFLCTTTTTRSSKKYASSQRVRLEV